MHIALFEKINFSCIATTTLKLHTFNDANWAFNYDNIQSIDACCVYLGNNLILWGCKLLVVVAPKLNISFLPMLLQKFNG